MKKQSVLHIKPLAIYLLIVWPVLLVCLLLVLSGRATADYHGIAADSSGKLYVGTSDDIEVYDSGRKVGSISPQTSRGYVFTVREDDTLLVSVGSESFELNTDGQVLSVISDDTTSIYNRLNRTKNSFETASGDDYRMRSVLGRRYVVKNGAETVYVMPILDYIVRIGLALSVVSLFIFGAVFAVKRSISGL